MLRLGPLRTSTGDKVDPFVFAALLDASHGLIYPLIPYI